MLANRQKKRRRHLGGAFVLVFNSKSYFPAMPHRRHHNPPRQVFIPHDVCAFAELDHPLANSGRQPFNALSDFGIFGDDLHASLNGSDGPHRSIFILGGEEFAQTNQVQSRGLRPA
jgi:hypothetical protein